MTEKTRWIRWKLVNRKGRATKVPLTIADRAASSTGASTWSAFPEAAASSVGAGLGFVLGDGVGCIDLDRCVTDGVVADWASEILDRCPPTFIEVSQSGEGLHIFGLLPEGAGRNIRRGDTAVEFYSVGRYIAMTGDRFGGSPLSLADLSEVIASIS